MRKISRDDIQLEEIKYDPKPLLVYTMWGDSDTWISKYRITGPLKVAKQLGIADVVVDRGNQSFKEYTDAPAEEARFQAMAHADVHLYHLAYSPKVLQLCLMEPRPAIIFGADDHTEAIEPYNPQFAGLGTRGMHGEPLEPGKNIYMVNDTGEHLPIWKDKVNIEHGVLFDIARNIENLKLHKSVAFESDGVLVSTEPLRKVYASYGCKNIFVWPNSINFAQYPKVDLEEHGEEVRILWTGGSSHMADLYGIRDPLKNVMRKYPQAKFISFGQEAPVMARWFAEFSDRFEYIPWVDPDAYTYRLSIIGHDINLCPLRASEFNEAKSAIKWYESSVISRPAATLAGAFGPFLEIEDGQTGMLYESPAAFEAKLGQLIEDAALRRRLAHNAKDWVHEHRDIRKNVPALIEWMRGTSDKVKARYQGSKLEDLYGNISEIADAHQPKKLIEVP